jgi:DNA-binding LacI/PurR family transcriptional regulator
MSIARGAQRGGQRGGWAVALLDAHWDVELEAANIRSLPEMGARGALVLPPFSSTTTADALHALQASSFPMVLVDMGAPGLRADMVSSDHEAGAQLATRYLFDRGHRRVLFLTHPPVSSSVVSRVAGYEQALRRAGIEPRPEWKAWIDLAVHQEGYRQGRKWWGGCQAILPLLRELQGPVAVLAVDSYTGWGVYEACRQLGLRIPEDVSVIAFDDIEIAHAVSPQMTIVSQRTDEIGRAAVDLLEKRIQSSSPRHVGRRQITNVLIDVDLIERESVATIR